MRIDRLTSKLQLALSDAQSLAVGLDHPAIEPAHLMQACSNSRAARSSLC
jgi:ATP-dependent Clp protease ATP-binding subunit ClpB